MRHTALLAAVLTLGSTRLLAQDIVTGPGWEAFLNVEYQGGDATQPKKKFGVLVLTDSTVALHACRHDQCRIDKKDDPFLDEAIFTVPLTQVISVSSSSLVRGASTGDKLLLGGLAGSHSEEFFAFSYETASRAEAPVFRVPKNQAGALEAKFRFRLKKLGVKIPERTP